jgi:Domain of unknown function (DUF4375)
MFEDPTGRFQRLSAEYSRTFNAFERAGYSLDVLSPPQRVFLLVFMADSAINSDGIYSLWFNNHGLLDTPEVVDSFRAVGAQTRGEVIDTFIRVAGHIATEADIDARAEQMERLASEWPDDDDLSEKYYDCDDDVDDLLLAYLNRMKNAEQAAT